MIFRIPHKTIDKIFAPTIDVKGLFNKINSLIESPTVSEKYGYSIRINESRLLPEEITKFGIFHRQKLKKAVITLSLDEEYELNDANCYRIRRLEGDLYGKYLPPQYDCDNVVTYQWNQTRDDNLHGQFNFYYNITNESVNLASMSVYMILLLIIAIFGGVLTELVLMLLGIY
jgi:hypothetical protein